MPVINLSIHLWTVFLSWEDLNSFLSLSVTLGIKPLRDSKGRFRSIKPSEKKAIVPLDQSVLHPLIGNLLGDGSLIFTKKDLEGKPKPNSNAHFAMTLKNKDYVYHLWGKIYSSICTSTIPNPWPNPKTGKPTTQYHFSTRSLVSLSLLHSQWYKWSDSKSGFIKIVPLNIGDLLTPIGLAHWIMDDGYKHGRGIVICTESFTLFEVELLKSVLEKNFGLQITINIRKTSTSKIGYRIYINASSYDKLVTLVKPYFIPEMYYKLYNNKLYDDKAHTK